MPEQVLEICNLWQYHQLKPKAGRRLKLLEIEEIVIALPLLYRLISLSEFSNRADWFVDLDIEHRNSLYIELSESLSKLNKLRKTNEDLSVALSISNKLLNRYFSDYGWRMVRKELSQIKKRKKKSHIEISNDLVSRLKEYMASHQIDTFDQAIDTLLSEQASFAQQEIDNLY
ncbi:hypothetical protein TUM4438_42140 [Shewanella sairae]|uniref:Uncharacterized protein n=1 Tax=Shewanella sairae TaxID=190310 RepID=A0ABQ4PQT7_9GAMM|nr:hypothetical protein [Shewanella sairae]MCL1130608.1 hypothetical protein [Shewanella sairae]GIU51677.1 hypothetical protein TUM4438_42140 [Shewanella sairae]